MHSSDGGSHSWTPCSSRGWRTWSEQLGARLDWSCSSSSSSRSRAPLSPFGCAMSGPCALGYDRINSADDSSVTALACRSPHSMLNRRTFLCGLTLGTLSAPLAAEAQQAAKVPRIGWLATNLAANPHLREAFRQGLRDLGYVEGRNVVIEYRDAEGKLDRLPALAAELITLKVDVIVAASAAATMVRQASDQDPPHCLRCC